MDGRPCAEWAGWVSALGRAAEHLRGRMATARREAGAAGPCPTSQAGGAGSAGDSAEEQGDGLVRVQAQLRHATFDIRRFSSRSSEIMKLAKAASRRGSVPLRIATVVLAQGHVAHPVDAVLDTPVATVQPQQTLRRRPLRRQAGQQVHGFRLALATVHFVFDRTPQLRHEAHPGDWLYVVTNCASDSEL